MNDNVNNPYHYNQGRIECIDAIKSAVVNKKGIEAVCVANIIKYLFRYENKNGLEDIRKSQWYLNRLIQELEEKDNNNQEADCKFCLFNDLDANQEPCVSCKNCYSEIENEYNNFPLKFQPKT